MLSPHPNGWMSSWCVGWYNARCQTVSFTNERVTEVTNKVIGRRLASGAGVLMSVASFSFAGVAVDTEVGICDTRFINRLPDEALITDTRRPVCQDTDEGSCETGPLGLMIIVR